MAYEYSAGVSVNDSDGRSLNFTQTPTITVYDFDDESEIATPAPSIVNLSTGLYKVKITIDTLTTVAFKIVHHVDDQDAIEDIKVMQVKAEHVADEILTDTGTTLPAEINAVDTDVWTYSSRTLTQSATSIISAVSGSSISQVRGSTWNFDISDVTLDSNKQVFYIKRSSNDADADALLGIDSSTGLLTLNGVSTGLTAGDASVSLSGTTLTVTAKASVTADLPAGNWKYGIQDVTAGGTVSENYKGDFTLTADIIRATS